MNRRDFLKSLSLMVAVPLLPSGGFAAALDCEPVAWRMEFSGYDSRFMLAGRWLDRGATVCNAVMVDLPPYSRRRPSEELINDMKDALRAWYRQRRHANDQVAA